MESVPTNYIFMPQYHRLRPVTGFTANVFGELETAIDNQEIQENERKEPKPKTRAQLPNKTIILRPAAPIVSDSGSATLHRTRSLPALRQLSLNNT